MEREKQEKKENILKITKQLQEVGKTSYGELKDQGVQLKKTHRDVKQISGHVKGIDRNLAEIQANRKGRGALIGCLYLICCCSVCGGPGQMPKKPEHGSARPKSVTSLNAKSDERLTAERIEREWCMRYDPEERWIKQVELGDFLSLLLLIAQINFNSSNYLISLLR